MEKNEINRGFENFLKEKSEQYMMYPSDRVWSAINQSIHPRRKWPYVVVTALFIGLGIGGNIHDSSIAGHPETRVSTHRSIVAHDPIGHISSWSASGRPASPALASGLLTGEIPSMAPKSTRLIRQGARLSAGPMAQVKAWITKPVRTEIASATPEESVTYEPLIRPAADINLYLDKNEFVINAKSALQKNVSAELKQIREKLATESRVEMPKTTAIRVLKPYKQKFGWQFFVTPTVSYRNLSGQGIRTFNPASGSFMYSGDVNSVVTHSPMLGTEAGVALVFAMNKKLRFKTGFQFNMSQYQMQAYTSNRELVPMTSAGIGHSQVNAYSTFRTLSGTSKTALRNRHTMIAFPVGAELSVYEKRNLQLNIAGSIQPTFLVNNQSYMISSDLKNYAQAPVLYRNFNLNSALEAFISLKKGNNRYNFGPQVRYQLMSSYQKEYPISEHLLEYGFKIGVTRTIQ